MEFDLVIVGGGLAGLSFALALRESRLRIALIDAAPPPPRPGEDWDARVYAVTPANAAFLGEIGVWSLLDPSRLTPVYDMRVQGDDGAQLHFSAYESGVSELAWIAEGGRVLYELYESARRQPNLSLFLQARPAAFEQDEDGVRIALEDGRALAARLAVGADGAQSWLRQRAGLAGTLRPYGEMGVVANFSCELPHDGCAFQWFRDDGILAWLPLAGQRLSMVWSAPDALAQELVALPAPELAARVAEAGGSRLGRLEALTPATAFPLRFMRVPQVTAPRLALIGDAAHAIHPLSGHGINLGFQDARALAALLAAAREWQDIGDAALLARYARARKEEVLLTQSVADGLHRLFRNDLPGLRPLRKLGMNLTDRLPVIKNLLTRYAMR